MTINLYLVRHGQTLFNQQHRMQGSSDSALTQLGIKQVETLRDYFEKNNIVFDKAYCSTQERASDTLEIITGPEMEYTRLKDLKEKIMAPLKERRHLFGYLDALLLDQLRTIMRWLSGWNAELI